MTDLVPGDRIERVVGARRHHHHHLGRAVSAEQTVYILHSQRCLDGVEGTGTGTDLRDCVWSVTLDRGIARKDWVGFEDRAVVLGFRDQRLVPVEPEWLHKYLL